MQSFISHGIFCQIRKIPRLILFIFYLIYKFCTKDSSFYYDIKIIGKLCAGSRTTPRWGCAGGNAESGVPGDKPMDQKRSIPGVARAGQRLKLSAARRSIMRQINGHPLLSLNRCDRPGAGPARLSLRQREREREREREINGINPRLLTGSSVISLASPAWGEAGFLFLTGTPCRPILPQHRP